MNNDNNLNNMQQPMMDPNGQMMPQQPMMDPNAQMMGQQPMMDPNAQMMGQQPMMDPNAQMMGQQPMMDPNAQMYGQQPMMDPNAQMYGQQPMMNPNAQMYGQQPMMNPNAQMMGQQPMMDPNAQMYGQQPMMDPNAQMMGQQPMMDPNAQMMGQQPMMGQNPQMTPQQGMGMPPQQPIDNNQISTETHEEKPKKKLPILPILLILILGVGGFFGYKLFFNNKLVVETEIKTMLTAANKGIDAFLKNTTNLDSSKNIIGYTGTLTMESDYVSMVDGVGIDLTKLKDYKLTYTGASDAANNASSLHATLSNAAGPFIDIKTVTKDNNAYLYLGDIYGKIIKMDAETAVINANVDKSAQLKATKDLIERTEPLLLAYIEDSKIDKTSEEKTINGRSKKYNKISYTFKSLETKQYLLGEYLKDDKILDDLAIILEKTKEEVKTEIETEKNATEGENGVVVINAYKTTFSTSAEMIEIVFYDEQNADNKSTIELTFDGDTTKFRILENAEEVYTGKITDNEFHMTNSNQSMDLNVKFDDNNISGDLSASVDGATMFIDFSSKNDDSTVTTKVDFNIASNGEEMNFSIKNEMKVTTEAQVDGFDTTYAVTVDQITPEEQQYIYTQLQQKLQVIAQDLMGVQYRVNDDLNSFFNK